MQLAIFHNTHRHAQTHTDFNCHKYYFYFYVYRIFYLPLRIFILRNFCQSQLDCKVVAARFGIKLAVDSFMEFPRGEYMTVVTKFR